MIQYIKYSKKWWNKYYIDTGNYMLELGYKQSILMHWFNGRKRNAILAARYWKYEQEQLQAILAENDLVHTSHYTTASRIMRYVNRKYPSSLYYKHDKVETWNTPMTTIAIFEGTEDGTCDCDDYSLLIYGLCRAAGIPQNLLRLCFVKTMDEWHLNVMFIYEGVPYCIEGTYYPSIAERYFGRLPYMHLRFNNQYYYENIWFLFNEDGCWKNKYYGKE